MFVFVSFVCRLKNWKLENDVCVDHYLPVVVHSLCCTHHSLHNRLLSYLQLPLNRVDLFPSSARDAGEKKKCPMLVSKTKRNERRKNSTKTRRFDDEFSVDFVDATRRAKISLSERSRSHSQKQKLRERQTIRYKIYSRSIRKEGY